jgi:hypothetical protein
MKKSFAMIALITIFIAPAAGRTEPLSNHTPAAAGDFRAVAPTSLALAAPPALTPASAVSPPAVEVEERAQRYRQARFRRNLGIGLAVPGIILASAGIATFLTGVATGDLGSDCAHCYGVEILIGSPLLAVGVALLVPGGVLWGIGQRDVERYR